MKKWGNAKANAYWEAEMPAGHKKPTIRQATDLDPALVNFIRDKYERRKWARQGGPVENAAVSR